MCPCTHRCLFFCDVLFSYRLNLVVFWKWIYSSAALWQWEMEGKRDLLSMGLPAGKWEEKKGREQGSLSTDSMGNIHGKCHSL